MNEQTYFEQFVGDVKTYSMWRDERMAKILDEAGLSSVHWQSVSGIGKDGDYRCDIISREFTKEELLVKLESVRARYDIRDIRTFKPTRDSNEHEAHAHFMVNLK